jgi:hypothetical protein
MDRIERVDAGSAALLGAGEDPPIGDGQALSKQRDRPQRGAVSWPQRVNGGLRRCGDVRQIDGIGRCREAGNDAVVAVRGEGPELLAVAGAHGHHLRLALQVEHVAGQRQTEPHRLLRPRGRMPENRAGTA